MKLGDKTHDGWVYLCRIDDEVTLIQVEPVKERYTWDEAMGKFTLPTCAELALMFDNKDKLPFLPSGAVWSARRYGSSRAYYQWLDDGSQRHYLRVEELSVRPVRRLTIQAFNDLYGSDGPVSNQCKSGGLPLLSAFRQYANEIWIIHSSNGPSRVKHYTQAEAEAEVKRLANKQPNTEYYVCKAVKKFIAQTNIVESEV